MTNTNNIVKNLKNMVEEKLSHQLMNMTISDIARLMDRLDRLDGDGRAKAPRKTRRKASRRVKVKGKTAVRRRRRLAPLGVRIAEFVKGASFTEWRSVGDIARRSGGAVPNASMRHAMLKGYREGGKSHQPVLGWNKVARAGAKYRRIGG